MTTRQLVLGLVSLLMTGGVGADGAVDLVEQPPIREAATLKKDEEQEPIRALAFAPDGKMLASADEHGFRLWDPLKGEELWNHQHEEVFAIAFSLDGKALATGLKDKTVRLWEPSTGKEWLKLQGHQEAVTAVAFSPDGRVLASGSYDGTIRLWELPTGKELRTIEVNEEGVTSIAFSPDGKTVASGGIVTTEVTIADNLVPVTQADVVHLWDVGTGKGLRTLDGRGSVVAFSSDGKMLASGGLTAVFHINQKPGKPAAVFLSGHHDEFRGNQVYGGMIRVNAISIQAFPMVRLWDVATSKEVSSRELGTSRNVGSAIAFSPDGKLLAAGAVPVLDFRSTRGGNLISTQEGPVLASLWEIPAGKLLRKFDGETTAVAFTPDGKTLATGAKDGAIRLWEVTKLREKKSGK